MAYKTPGVYIEEIDSFPPSVVPVSTAIPAFIGYTTITNRDGDKIIPVRITSLLDYTEQFGDPEPTPLTVTLTANGTGIIQVTTPLLKNLPLMYHSLNLYFKNGGGPCYVVSVGDTTNFTLNKDDLEAGLTALEKEDEPTLILQVDAVRLAEADYNALCQAALLQCYNLKDRFCIFDVLNYDDNDGSLLNSRDAVAAFRNGIGINNLNYGAAYYPYLKTALTYPYTDDSVQIIGFTDEIGEYDTDPNGLRITYVGPPPDTGAHKVVIDQAADNNFAFTIAGTDAKTLTISLPNGDSQPPADILAAWKNFTDEKDQFDLAIAGNGNTDVNVDSTTDGHNLEYVSSDDATLADLKYDRTALYNQIKTVLDQERIIMPPSSAMAGVYAFVDNSIGVWKAPANVSLASVIEPIVKLNSADQEDFNVDANSGKSVDVIRTFTGKGILVWGARTLEGNSNDWRYINVRRLFIYAEESIQKATFFAVFESNTAVTWLKVRAMIESFLEDLWHAGGLAGATKDDAFFVNVGLGSTMTAQDILEGYMKVEIGMAPVRPAEFIILKFSQKLQES